MKRIIKLCTMLIAWASVWMVSCKPEEFLLGNVDVNSSEFVEGIAYKIEHDANNPNIVYLTSLMGSGYTPLWDHPQGRSQDHKVTLKIPFAGTYTVQFGVETRGGVVFGEPATFTIDDFYAGFVDHELWELLSGGVGNEKTWYLDLDEESLSRYFVGPLYFYGMDDSWETVTEGKTVEGDSWNWKPDYKGNSWLMAAGDYGTMTFSLKDGATVRVDHKMLANRGVEQGTYMIDTDNYTMRMNDASPLHNAERDGHVVDWGNIRILSLTENYMQLGVIRDKVLSGEDPCLLVYNFISKDYKDNWVPGNQPEPEPPYDGNANDDLTTSTTTSKKWALSLSTPYNWSNLAGEFLNEWSNPSDYMASGWAPYNESLIKNISLTLDKTGANRGTYVFTDGAGAKISGTYTTDEKNNLIFDKNISFAISDWVSLGTTADNMLRIIRADKDVSGNISGLWLGQRDSQKDEYMVYKFEPAASGTSDPLAVWKNALAGKTFTPDVNWFVDWVDFPPSFSGGWTDANTFGSDYTTNSWVWDANVRAVAESAKLYFKLEGDQLKLELTQIKNGLPSKLVGDVVINPTNNRLNINIPLVDYIGTAAAWLPTTNSKSVTTSQNDWYFVPHGGANLSNISTNGIWLGAVANAKAHGDDKDEVIAFHYVLSN